jgi:hypothetical protein
MAKAALEFGWTGSEEKFIEECREQVENGECTMSAGDLANLLKILDKYRPPNPEEQEQC